MNMVKLSLVGAWREKFEEREWVDVVEATGHQLGARLPDCEYKTSVVDQLLTEVNGTTEKMTAKFWLGTKVACKLVAHRVELAGQTLQSLAASAVAEDLGLAITGDLYCSEALVKEKLMKMPRIIRKLVETEIWAIFDSSEIEYLSMFGRYNLYSYGDQWSTGSAVPGPWPTVYNYIKIGRGRSERAATANSLSCQPTA